MGLTSSERMSRATGVRTGRFARPITRIVLACAVGLTVLASGGEAERAGTVPEQGDDARARDFANTRGIGAVFSPTKLKEELARKHGSAEYAQNVVATVKLLDGEKEQKPAAEEAQKLSIVLDVKKLPAGSDKPVSSKDGEVLRDSGGPDNKGDKYRVCFSASQPCYAYVMQLDVTGKVFPLFPSKVFAEGLSNPPKPDQVYQVPPGGDLWLFLDQSKGDESLYFLFSKQRRVDLEEKLAYFDEANQSLVSGEASALSRSVRPYTTRGIAGVKPVTDAPQGSSVVAKALAGAKWYEPKRSEVVITRWFKHE